jgi:hypothetical protein
MQLASIADPESFSRIRIRTKNIPDPSSSGPEMNLKPNYSEKLIKFDKFLHKKGSFKKI